LKRLETGQKIGGIGYDGQGDKERDINLDKSHMVEQIEKKWQTGKQVNE